MTLDGEVFPGPVGQRSAPRAAAAAALPPQGAGAEAHQRQFAVYGHSPGHSPDPAQVGQGAFKGKVGPRKAQGFVLPEGKGIEDPQGGFPVHGKARFPAQAFRFRVPEAGLDFTDMRASKDQHAQA